MCVVFSVADGGGRVQVQRFHSPFRHWLSGLGVELLVFGAFIMAVGTLMAVLVWIL